MRRGASLMPIRTERFIADVWPLNTLQTGAYAKLCLLVWRDILPSDEKGIARAVGLSRKKWGRVLNDLVRFGLVEVQGGKIVLPRLWEMTQPETRPSIPMEVRAAVFARDGFICQHCGETEGRFHLDHLVPWSKGGPHTVDNLVVSCAPCNLRRGNKDLAEWEVA